MENVDSLRHPSPSAQAGHYKTYALNTAVCKKRPRGETLAKNTWPVGSHEVALLGELTRTKGLATGRGWSSLHTTTSYMISVSASRSLFSFNIYFYLFIWLHRVFCGMWDLVPPPGIEPRASALRAQSLSHWTTRGVPENFLELTLLFIENTNQVLLHLYTLPVPVVVFNWSLQLNTTQNNLILTQKPKDCTSPSIYKIIKP